MDQSGNYYFSYRKIGHMTTNGAAESQFWRDEFSFLAAIGSR